MTAMFRMAIALLFQSVAYLFRCILFLCLGIIRPIDYLSDALQRVAIWLAVDESVLRSTYGVKESQDERRADNE
jgi:predicted aspartyl protease